MRTWPASTSAAALVRAFTRRACHSHLSRRWRSNEPFSTDGDLIIFLTRFLHANRYPPPDQVRGHASLENAMSSRRWRSTPPHARRLFLPARRHLLLERGELGERRIGIGRTIAITRRRARRILAMRRTAFPAPVAVAAAPVTPLVAPTFAGCVIAVAEFGPVAVLTSLAVETIARPAVLVFALVGPRVRCRSRTGRGGAICRR